MRATAAVEGLLGTGTQFLDADAARLAARTGRGRHQPLLAAEWLRQLSAPTVAFIGLKTIFNDMLTGALFCCLRLAS